MSDKLSLIGSLWPVMIAASAYQAYLYFSIKQEIIEKALELNNTIDKDPGALIFNRVPKAGSEMLWGLIDTIAVQNNFTSYSDNQELKAKRGFENTYLLDKSSRETVAKMWSEDLTPPYSYVKHINFLDTEEFGFTAKPPIWVNIVRHPVERIRSWYYYIRGPAYQLREKKVAGTTNQTTIEWKGFSPSIKMFKTTYEDCVLQGNNECIYEPGQGIHASGQGGSHYSQITFFCGMDIECNWFESDAALQKAKQNVDKHFAVVAVLEEIEKSLRVLEHYVPRFFTGVGQAYQASMDARNHGNRRVLNENLYKPKKPKNYGDIRKILVANFTKEIEFYEFCKARLHKQYLTTL